MRISIDNVAALQGIFHVNSVAKAQLLVLQVTWAAQRYSKFGMPMISWEVEDGAQNFSQPNFGDPPRQRWQCLLSWKPRPWRRWWPWCMGNHGNRMVYLYTQTQRCVYLYLYIYIYTHIICHSIYIVDNMYLHTHIIHIIHQVGNTCARPRKQLHATWIDADLGDKP